MSRHRTVADHVCPVCQKRYRPRSENQIYCSLVCRWGVVAADAVPDANLREEIEAAKQERATAPLYRYWSRHL